MTALEEALAPLVVAELERLEAQRRHGETGTRITAGDRRLFFAGLAPVELARAFNLGMNEAVALFARRLARASMELAEETLRDVSLNVVMSVLYDRWARKRGLELRQADLDSSATREALIAQHEVARAGHRTRTGLQAKRTIFRSLPL